MIAPTIKVTKYTKGAITIAGCLRFHKMIKKDESRGQFRRMQSQVLFHPMPNISKTSQTEEILRMR